MQSALSCCFYRLLATTIVVLLAMISLRIHNTVNCDFGWVFFAVDIRLLLVPNISINVNDLWVAVRRDINPDSSVPVMRH